MRATRTFKNLNQTDTVRGIEILESGLFHELDYEREKFLYQRNDLLSLLYKTLRSNEIKRNPKLYKEIMDEIEQIKNKTYEEYLIVYSKEKTNKT
jgi:hypothetical protein